MQSSKNTKRTTRSAAATSATTKRPRKSSAKDPIAAPDVAVAHTPAAQHTPAILSDVQSSVRVPVNNLASHVAAQPGAAQPEATHPEVTHSEATHPEVTHEDIARLAFSLWQQRGYAHGNPEQDWLRAEQQLKARTAAASA